MEQAKITSLAPAKAALIGLLFALLFLLVGGIAVAASYNNDGGSHDVDAVHSDGDADHSEDDADHSETDSDADHSESDEEHSE